MVIVALPLCLFCQFQGNALLDPDRGIRLYREDRIASDGTALNGENDLMAHEHGSDHAHQATGTPSRFTAAEIHTFHANDRKEATIVVALITAIFVIGVVIYTTVATVVYQYPQNVFQVSAK